jgi:hypothetical protein
MVCLEEQRGPTMDRVSSMKLSISCQSGEATDSRLSAKPGGKSGRNRFGPLVRSAGALAGLEQLDGIA